MLGGAQRGARRGPNPANPEVHTLVGPLSLPQHPRGQDLGLSLPIPHAPLRLQGDSSLRIKMSISVLRTVLLSQEQSLGGGNVNRDDVALGLIFLTCSFVCRVTLNAILVKLT